MYQTCRTLMKVITLWPVVLFLLWAFGVEFPVAAWVLMLSAVWLIW